MPTLFHRPNTLKGILVTVGDFFNNYTIQKTKDDNTIETIKVPLKFNASKTYSERLEDYTHENLNQKNSYYLQFPRMSLTMTNIVYDTSRRTSNQNSRYIFPTSATPDNIDVFIESVEPVPYNITIELDVISDKLDYHLQLLENILPYFGDSVTLRMKELHFVDGDNTERDIILKYDGQTELQYIEPMDKNQKREIRSTLTFTAKAFMYRPVVNDKKFIKTIQWNTFINDLNNGSTLEYSNVTSAFNELSAMPDSTFFETSGDLISNVINGYFTTSGSSQ